MDKRRYSARARVLTCSRAVECRRFGKTTLGIDRAISADVLNYPVGWFAPSYKMMLDVWRDVERIVRPITARRSVQDHRIEYITGGLIEMWSLDNPDAGRGRKYKRIIVDEAAMIKNLMEAWNAAIRPTLTDFRGDAWFLSTPKGRNGFYNLYQLGADPLDPEWACWQKPTTANPFIDPAEVEAARRTLPERIFAQEYLAEFLEDAGGVFRNVPACATATAHDKSLQPGRPYVVGVDWGKLNDFTVFTVLDAIDRSMVALDRFNQIDYSVQAGRLVALCERFNPVAVVVERNSIGEPIIEALLRAGLPVVAFHTSNASKTAIIDALALAFERKDIAILPDPVLVNELQSYEMERLPSGLLRYSAPEGLHDDCVMSLALAWSELAAPNPTEMIVHDEALQISPY